MWEEEGGFGTASFLVRPRRKKFCVDCVVVEMVMGTCFWIVPFAIYFITVNSLSLLLS